MSTKQMKKGLCEYMWDMICQINLFRRTFKTASRLTGGDGILVLLDGYNSS